ncbi:MAG: hypothetical protein ACTSRU_04335 [Candidatus Hodarchaeales archaeon]
MNDDTRRLYLNNWAILTADSEILWHFGDIKEKQMHQTLDFVNSLSKLGSEIWGTSSIGSIRLRYPRPHPTQARDIMIVNLLNKYNVVVSDPLVTTRLMTKIKVDSDPDFRWDEIRSILAGTASVIYSEFYSYDKIIDHEIVDELFREAVNAVTYNSEEVTVGSGQCSFSALTFEELLFFHALLKELFETYITTKQAGKPWGIISSVNGAPIYLEYEPPADPALITAFISVIINYCRMLFGASPERLIFGHSVSAMDIISTEKNAFICSSAKKLLKLQKFVRTWKKVPPEVIYDLAPAIKDYVTELTLVEQREIVRSLGFHRIINRLTGMGIRRARSYKLPPLPGMKKK